MKSKTLCTLLLGIVALTGCSQKAEKPQVVMKGTFEGYNTRISTGENRDGRKVILMNGVNYLRAVDLNNDGRFDEITLDAPIGHPFEQYATIPQMEKTYQSILENSQ